ncbi:MAG: chromosome segregation protein SMC [Candidatus Krumholzibacteriota bacterium]|nr:chromosome segregation protein SMC [Candidatus Krumholzibacteriota bacterium]
MSLSRLELVGFKSFMAPVTIDLRKGITAILGPNGCGKTNIVDAVRWVLGEQSARQLRSSKMENVIFNGTQKHRPTGYAVVNMTLSNEKGFFPVDYSEIMITRKVYRSGISEYFINKAPCRLKDIKELFADTGTGSHSYAVIEQEMVDYVLNDAHGERRQMFEEAAGIVKYRMRREEAKRKLKLTEGDLVRLEDILEELDAQVRSLRYQVGKAKRYARIVDRIRAWSVIKLRRNLSALVAGKREAEAALGELHDRSCRGDDSLGDLERRVEEGKFEIVELENRHTDRQNARYGIRRNIQTAEEKVIQLTERRGEAERRIERARREIEEARIRLEKIAEKSASADASKASVEERIREVGEKVNALNGEFTRISASIDSLKSRLIELKQTELDFLQDQARARSAIEHYEKLLADLDAQAAEMRGRVVDLEGETIRRAAVRDERAGELLRLEERLAALAAEREEMEQAKREAVDRLGETERELAGSRTDAARLVSRHDLLCRMQEEYEGYPGGARYVLTKGDERVRGPLGDLMRVGEKHRLALDAVLGGVMDGVVIDGMTGAADIARELLEKRTGGARLLVGDAGKRPDADLEAPPDSIGRLVDVVETDEAGRELARRLLGDVVLFEDIDAAIAWAAGGGDAVTLSGIHIGLQGICFAGTPGEEISLLARGEEIERTGRAIAELEERIEALEADSVRERGNAAELDGRGKGVAKEIEEIRAAISSKSAEVQVADRGHLTVKEQCSMLMQRLEETERSRVEILSSLEETRLSLEMSREKGEVSEVPELESRLAGLQEERSRQEAELTDRKVELASLQGSIDRTLEELRGLGEMREQFAGLVAQRETEIVDSEREAAELAEGIEAERGGVGALLEEERACQAELETLGGSLEKRREAVAAIEKELKELKSERDGVIARENEFRVKLSTIEARMRELIDRGKEMHETDLSCYLEGTELPLTDEERAVTDEMLEKEKEKLERIGPVNLAAVEEYEEKNRRLEFLTAQRDDLVKAREELLEAISRINRQARKIFVETFEKVRGFFGETFRVLFEGGDAALSLEEGTDPLEADVKIVARPKGKRFQDISLLSGGERALTAMALLFALYKAKPSPFCIFDEVDAPLDDANIQRFVRMLKKFSEDTQFIIITHNKRTMEAADRLYGVTMQERGVSSVVSVDLTDVEDVMEKKRPASAGVLAGAAVSRQ